MVLEKMQESVTSLIEKYDNIPLLVKLSVPYSAIMWRGKILVNRPTYLQGLVGKYLANLD